jgi:integrase
MATNGLPCQTQKQNNMRKIRVKKYNTKVRPHLKFVVGWREGGRRKRRFFEAKEPANAFAAFKNSELLKYGVESIDRLSAYGKTLHDAINFYVAHLEASERSITAAELVDQIIAKKKADGMSDRYVGDLRSRLPRFAESFGDQMVATITTTQIDDWLRALEVGPTTRNNFRRALVMVFAYAIRHGYAASNPAEETEKAKQIDLPPGILTVQQTASLLESSTPELLPYVAIGAFAGLRRAEIERLDWSEIDFDDNLIEVTARNSKTARRRLVKIQPNLREWLLPVRKHRGPVTSEDFIKEFYQARVAAGIKKWPGNALRHSFASYHLAHFRNVAELALEIGHTNSAITFAHYREIVKPKDAERYWQIMPAVKATKKIIRMT